MNREELFIKWDSGSMMIYLNAFFPCSVAKLNKLLKIIDLDYDHRDDLKDRLLRYFQQQVMDLDYLKKKYSDEYYFQRQNCYDIGQMVKSKKRPNGVPLTKREWEDCKEKLKNAQNAVKNCMSRFLQCEKDIKSFEKLLENMKKRR